MPLKSTTDEFGRLAQIFHWISAILIVLMVPMGFAMQNIDNETTKVMIYQIHAVIGIAVLLLTIARVIWKRIDINPDLPPGFSPLHAIGFKAVHFLLYTVLLVLAASGIGILAISELGDTLFGSQTAIIPQGLGDLPPRQAHGIMARLFIALFIAHVGGVLLHQFTKSNVLARMGWKR
ncbi:MAG: cytochrome b [Calditrichia bacterium]